MKLTTRMEFSINPETTESYVAPIAPEGLNLEEHKFIACIDLKELHEASGFADLPLPSNGKLIIHAPTEDYIPQFGVQGLIQLVPSNITTPESATHIGFQMGECGIDDDDFDAFNPPVGHFFGTPIAFQDEPIEELKALAEEKGHKIPENLSFLFQINSFEGNPYGDFGDMGSIYFYGDPSKTKVGDFNEIYYLMQCS